MGLPRSNRLKARRDFQAVYQYGIRRSSPHLTLRALLSAKEESEKAAPRIGISISQKVSKKAAARNRIKRQIRAAIRGLLSEISPGWLMVVVVHPKAVECDYEHFLRELKELLVKAEIINGH